MGRSDDYDCDTPLNANDNGAVFKCKHTVPCHDTVDCDTPSCANDDDGVVWADRFFLFVLFFKLLTCDLFSCYLISFMKFV